MTEETNDGADVAPVRMSGVHPLLLQCPSASTVKMESKPTGDDFMARARDHVHGIAVQLYGENPSEDQVGLVHNAAQGIVIESQRHGGITNVTALEVGGRLNRLLEA